MNLTAFTCSLTISLAATSFADVPRIALFNGPAAVSDDLALNFQQAPTTSEREERIEKILQLTPDQKPKVEPILEQHLNEIQSYREDESLTKPQRRAKIKASLTNLETELQPLLTEEQNGKLHQLVKKAVQAPIISLIPRVSASYSLFFPSGTTARSIFGKSPSSFGVGLGGVRGTDGKRLRFGFDFDTFSIPGSNNKFFSLSPQGWVEYRFPIEKGLGLFARAQGGPAYFDYSFNDPSGYHYGAKRFGADGSLAAGLRYGPLQLAATYRLMTEPAGINLNGIQLSLTYNFLRF